MDTTGPERAVRVFQLRRTTVGTCALCNKAMLFGEQVAITTKHRHVHGMCLAQQILAQMKAEALP